MSGASTENICSNSSPASCSCSLNGFLRERLRNTELEPSTDLHLVPLYGAHIPEVLQRENSMLVQYNTCSNIQFTGLTFQVNAMHLG